MTRFAYLKVDKTQLDGSIVWNAHNTVLGEESLLIGYTSFRYAT